MSPGPTLIVKPSGCTTPLKISTLNSGNTFGAVFWTDGKREAPMLNDEPWLRKHPGENVLFWTDEWELIDMEYNGNFGKGQQWSGLPYAEIPAENDYLAALESGIADTKKKLRDIRIRLWWVGNDPIRQSGVGTLPPHHIENFARLALLLSKNDPQQRLMKAEVFRELGFFKDARKLLGGDFPEELRPAVGFLTQLSIREDARVARFL